MPALTKVQRQKQRRQSRGPEDIRRDLDLRNTRRASQRSERDTNEVIFRYIFNKNKYKLVNICII
jgi:hypothetical protein